MTSYALIEGRDALGMGRRTDTPDAVEEVVERFAYVSPLAVRRIRTSFAMLPEGELPLYCSLATVLADLRGDEDSVIAALLSPAVAAGKVEWKPLVRTLRRETIALIRLLTALPRHTDDPRKALSGMVALLHEDIRVPVIVLAERLCALQHSHALPAEQRAALARSTLDTYVRLAENLCMRELAASLRDASASILDPESHGASMMARAAEERDAQEHVLPLVLNTLHEAYPGTALSLRPERSDGPIQRTGVETDVPARQYIIAVSCPEERDCYHILGALHARWKQEPHSFQDYINRPLPNGYQGLHTTVILPDGARVQCRIRTQEMDEYARNGVASLCFQHDAVGVVDCLAWAEHVPLLLEESGHASRDISRLLEREALGTHMVLHCGSDRAVVVPGHATALDGAFACFREKALWIQEIFVDGQSVPRHAQLRDGCALACTFSERRTVDRRWLPWATTALALSIVRSALGMQSTAKKALIGRNLLQEIMNEERKGFLDEFNAASLRAPLLALGFSSLDEAYIAIADGRTEPRAIVDALFPSTRSKGKISCAVHCSFPSEDTMAIHAITKIARDYGAPQHALRLGHALFGKQRMSARFFVDLAPEGQRLLRASLLARGITDVRVRRRSAVVAYGTAVAALIALWGADPLVMSSLLRDFSPQALTVLRFAAMLAFFSVAYGLQRIRSPQRLLPLPLRPSLVLAGCLLFLTALCSFAALTVLTPMHYILFITAGEVGALFVAELYGKRWRADIALSFLCLLGAIGFLAATRAVSVAAAGLGLAAAVAFTSYGIVSEHYQRANVKARYPSFLFWLAAVGLFCALPLLPSASLQAVPLGTIALAIGALILFSCIPYILYFECMKAGKASLRAHALPIICLVTIIGDVFVRGATVSAPLALMLGGFIASLLWGWKRTVYASDAFSSR